MMTREVYLWVRYVVVSLSQIKVLSCAFSLQNPHTMKVENFHIGRLIKETLKEKERSIAWLARQVNCDSCNLSRTLKNETHIHSALLLEICIALDEDFFVHYSEIVRKKREEHK